MAQRWGIEVVVQLAKAHPAFDDARLIELLWR
jgi:hypothetical protein